MPKFARDGSLNYLIKTNDRFIPNSIAWVLAAILQRPLK